jgi:sn-1 stearoyl-lipid 9-desaturase
MEDGMEPQDRCRVNSLVDGVEADSVYGTVRWDPVHSVWNGGMAASSLLLAPLLFSWGALAACVVLTTVTLLAGHSVGLHRCFIHRSFRCPLWVERVLVWLGTLVGMDGPFGMVRAHDLRDWAQRRPDCHPYLAHRRPLLVDGWWQLGCRLHLRHPPTFDLGRRGRDPVYRFLQRTWMLQQAPVAALLFLAGGWGWVVWGVCVRVSVSVTGHWYIGHLAHRVGPQSWLVSGSGVQAHNVPWAALPSMGEAWHNNHHAFPASARLGLLPGQSDWGYAFIRLLARCGLAWDVALPPQLGRDHLLTRPGA